MPENLGRVVQRSTALAPSSLLTPELPHLFPRPLPRELYSNPDSDYSPPTLLPPPGGPSVARDVVQPNDQILAVNDVVIPTAGRPVPS